MLWVASGCGTPYSAWTFHEERRAADAFADAKKYDEAIAAYTRLSKKAETQQDLQYLQFRSAYMLEQKGDLEAALEAYEKIYSRPVYAYNEYGARSMYRSGRIYRDQLGDQETAYEIWLATIRAYPNTFFADDALLELKRIHRNEDSYDAFIELMSELYVELQYSEIADNLAFETAKLLDDEFERCHDAIELYSMIERSFPRSGFVDDAIWRTALCYRAHDQTDKEVAVLNAFVDGREASIIIGDYDYDQYGPALKRLAEIEEERGELENAIRGYRRFQTTFPLSLDNDDLSFKIIELYDALGDVKSMRRYWDEMKKFWPESRYIPRAEALIRQAEARQ